MRLDHLLSKETSNKPVLVGNVLRSAFWEASKVTLFNLEGIRWKGEVVGGIAQLEEHLLCKQGVIGSSPITSTKMGQ